MSMYQDWKVVKIKKPKAGMSVFHHVVGGGKGPAKQDKVLAYAAKTGESVEVVSKGIFLFVILNSHWREQKSEIDPSYGKKTRGRGFSSCPYSGYWNISINHAG